MRPSSFLLVISILSAFVLPSLCDTENVTVDIEGATTIANTDRSFVCVTLDWWPAEKCNYGMCPWYQSSVLNLDLKNPILKNAIKAFNQPPLRVRIGGSLQDQIVYKVGKNHPKCEKLKLVKGALFDFSAGCLNMCRWKKLNKLFQDSGAVVTFGLNALYGRSQLKNDTLWEGSWNSSNARDFINHTISKGYNVDSWEFGNEISGDGVAAKVDVKQYSQDLIVLKALIDDLYKDKKKPMLLAPGGFFDQDWFAKMLQNSGPNVVDAVTHHIYNLGPGGSKELFGKMQDPFFLSQIAQTFKNAEETVKDFGPWSSAWIGEAGGAFNSGGPESGTFVDSFWYLDQLGMASKFNHKAYCRQALIGGNYALLDTQTFIPNPDYYSALLWHRLIGRRVLQATHQSSPYLRTYAHCGRDQNSITLVLINLSNSTAFNVSVQNDMNLYPPELKTNSATLGGQREVYHLTPKDGNLTSHYVLLNGKLLNVSSTGEIPQISPTITEASAPLRITPSSIVFVKFRNITAPACADREN
ncbi:uncharacterized protein A4U43_C08F17200 [Asparagus officinalis]|uniref:heparanase-like protein 2 n=1 Tax=Asparagus officinalis TaxID=4686 RepID=UPI00098E62F8|nr:heparanase-like protein 2 [Asparagus officinalis]ONK60337.1 uncharacterized protein A4U43_C08F17200 [Asparagus officinalis]